MKKCLVVLSGWAKKNKNGVWKTSGSSGVKLRITAAKHLWNKDKNLFIITAGKKGGLVNTIDKPLAEIISQELIELGVNKKMIIKESKSDNTYEHLVNLPKLIEKYKFDSVSIISNEWHLPRIKTMTECMFPELKILLADKKIELVAAEEVLVKAGPKKWTSKIQRIRASKAYKTMVREENKGIQDILNGRYKSTH